MLRRASEVIRVSFFNLRHLEDTPKRVVFFFTFFSLATAIIGQLQNNSSFLFSLASIFSLIGAIIPIMLAVSQLYTVSYKSCETNTEVMEKLNGDLTSSFDISTLNKGDLISQSTKLNKYLLQQPTIKISDVDKNFEARLLRTWKEFHHHQARFLVNKANMPGYLINEKKVSLLNSLTFDSDQVAIGKTSYFTSIVTNEISMKLLESEKHGTFDSSNAIYPKHNNEILEIGASKMSDHIGITVLAKSENKQLILWAQNDNAQQNVGKLVATGSGSLDWDDYSNPFPAISLLDLIKRGMVRELSEESNLPIDSFDLKNDILVIGYFRWIERGAKPEFVALAKSSMKSSTFEPNRDEVTGFVNGKRVNALATRSVEELKQNIQALQKGGNLSVPLDYLLKCIEQYLENRGSDEYRIITEFWGLE